MKVILPRTWHHLHPEHEGSKSDLAVYRARWNGESPLKLVDTAPDQLKFPSLGGGLARKADGASLTLAELDDYFGKEIERSSYYMRECPRPDGRIQYRREKTFGLHDLAITLRSDYALAFEELDSSGHSVAKYVEAMAHFTAESLQQQTRYRLVAFWAHPEEGRLHLHVTYSTVDENHRLIHQEGRRGRHGPVHAFPSVIGTVRLGRLGWLPDEWHNDAERWLKDRSKNGQEPLDWILSEALDGWIESWVQRQGETVQKVFAHQHEIYHQEIINTVARSPAAMAEALTRAKTEREAAELRAAKIEQRNVELNRELAALRLALQARVVSQEQKTDEAHNALTYKSPSKCLRMPSPQGPLLPPQANNDR
jgi:hypothetical protein